MRAPRARRVGKREARPVGGDPARHCCLECGDTACCADWGRKTFPGGGKGELSDQVSRENPASRGTETSGELSKYCKVTYGAEEK